MSSEKKEIAQKRLSGRNWAYDVAAIGYDDGTVIVTVSGKKVKEFSSPAEAADYVLTGIKYHTPGVIRSLQGNQMAIVLVSVASTMGAIPYGWQGWDNPEANDPVLVQANQ